LSDVEAKGFLGVKMSNARRVFFFRSLLPDVDSNRCLYFKGSAPFVMKRHKVKDRGIGSGRFPSQQLYTKYGLYKALTTAGWKSAHA
jgi:hypothetical protein